MTARTVKTLLPALTQQEGDGATVHRTIGRPELSVLDPFLLLDEFELKDGAGGFPEHPHRGFETVTYMFSGKMAHQDNKGGGGVIGPGDAQWMTAGSGLQHSEMPVSENGESVHGMQLWVNLPANEKMKVPNYQDVTAENLIVIEEDGSEIRLIAGGYDNQRGPVEGVHLDPTYMDIHLRAGQTMTLDLPHDHTAFVYPVEGSIEIDKQVVSKRTLAVLTDGDQVALSALETGRLIVAAARPTREPVARYGPFVMNTKEEIHRAISDYNNGHF
ncbi:pirin family protein [Temperatibacter marinus]|uniref:Pirin family protein n=1 Tax=Temperatibacter marinus TaxID=1456591 RepID=A0AA52EER7_9PROT|nr:pirin family protein [Temperatibacter marinus]WND03375.1 pirin family protein [Temperatibacter marinus]